MDASAASGVLNVIIFVGVFERVKVKPLPQMVA